MRAGSHFNVPYRLEKYLPLENIKTVNTGGFGARLKALLDGEVEAASLLPPQIAMAEQLGLRKIIEDTLQDAVVGAGEFAAGGRARLHARARSRRTGDGRGPRRNICRCGSSRSRPEFETYHPWDFSKFGRGERFVNKPLPTQEFDEVFAQVERWGLDQYLKDREPRDAELLGVTVGRAAGAAAGPLPSCGNLFAAAASNG